MQPKNPSTESTWVDPDDVPELTEEWFAAADPQGWPAEISAPKTGRQHSP